MRNGDIQGALLRRGEGEWVWGLAHDDVCTCVCRVCGDVCAHVRGVWLCMCVGRAVGVRAAVCVRMCGCG